MELWKKMSLGALGCSMTLANVSASPLSPIGYLDRLEYAQGKITCSGWGLDQDHPSENVKVIVYNNDQVIYESLTDTARNDVNTIYTTSGNHGFSLQIPCTSSDLKQEIKVVIEDVESGETTILGKKVFSFAKNSNPVGCVDSISFKEGKLRIQGWSFFQENPEGTVSIEAYAGNTLIGSSTASLARKDVNQAYSISGNHGFDFTLDTSITGTQTISIYAVDESSGAKKCIGTKSLQLNQAANSELNGHIDTLKAEKGRIKVGGWAADLNNPGSTLEVQVMIGNQCIASITPSLIREDVNKILLISGSHGFDQYVDTTYTGTQTISIYAYNPDTNTKYLLGTKTVDFPASSTNHNVQGCVDVLQITSTQIRTAGWSYDPDNAETSCEIQIRVNGTAATTITANNARQDVNKAYSISGSHGFDTTLSYSLKNGDVVSIYARDINTGKYKLLSEKTFTANTNSEPVGCLDAFYYQNGKIYLRGWTYDPDTISANVKITVERNGTQVYSLNADGERNDVNQAMKVSGKHGFSGTFQPDVTGNATYNVYMTDYNTGKKVLLKQTTITISTSTATKSSSKFEGCLDFATPLANGVLSVQGWIVDLNHPDQSVKYQLYVNDTKVAEATTNILRSDVNGAENATGNHGIHSTVSTNMLGKCTVKLMAVDPYTNKTVQVGNTKTVTFASKSKLISNALNEVGTQGGSKYRNWYYGYDPGTAWCAVFVSYIANISGVTTDYIPKFNNCEYGKNWYTKKGRYTSTPQDGYLVFFHIAGSTVNHVGIVVAVNSTTITTVEGNNNDSVRCVTYSINDSRIDGYGKTY